MHKATGNAIACCKLWRGYCQNFAFFGSSWQSYSPSICKWKFCSNWPASLLAIHVYLAVSISCALLISSCRPSDSSRMWASRERASPFLSQVTSGGGIPLTGHSRRTVRFWITFGLSTTLASSMLGGTVKYWHKDNDATNIYVTTYVLTYITKNFSQPALLHLWFICTRHCQLKKNTGQNAS